MTSDSRFPALEFFAGGGMARSGLQGEFDTVFANDFDAAKCAAYRANFGDADLCEGPIESLEPQDLPDAALAWASFPCQDVSLAGARSGLAGARSGVFWAFWRLMQGLEAEGRAPSLIALENVTGLLTSNRGADFTALIEAMTGLGYRTGALVLDAAEFVPQSRQRLFIIGFRGDPPAPAMRPGPDYGTSETLKRRVEALPPRMREGWVWWRLEAPRINRPSLADLVERAPPECVWRSAEKCEALLGSMTPAHRAMVEAAEAAGGFAVGAAYRRMREGAPRAEVRYDGLAGCLRTLKGGSSRQLLLVTESGRTRLRPLLAREGARLMGLDEDYALPDGATRAFNLLGDGVCPPLVRHLSRALFGPLIGSAAASASARFAPPHMTKSSPEYWAPDLNFG